MYVDRSIGGGSQGSGSLLERSITPLSLGSMSSLHDVLKVCTHYTVLEHYSVEHITHYTAEHITQLNILLICTHYTVVHITQFYLYMFQVGTDMGETLHSEDSSCGASPPHPMDP